MRHPVLLFDSAEGAARGHTCSVATLGGLVHGGAARGLIHVGTLPIRRFAFVCTTILDVTVSRL